MGRRLFAAFAIAIATSWGSSAWAQTTATGPYYALPSWDQQLPAASRFIVLANWNSEAVLDRETGLIWERTPVPDGFMWVGALAQCRLHLVGHRRGWRLPSYEELTSLLDPAQSSPALPSGHPFIGIGASDQFWTATTDEAGDAFAYYVEIASATTWVGAVKNNFSFRIWCVRGGSSTDNPR